VAREIRHGTVALCDYVAPGAGNRSTLVNVYSGDVLIKTFPAMIAFGLYVELLELIQEKIKANIEIRYDDQTVTSLDVELPPTGEDLGTSTINLQQFPLFAQKAAILEVYLTSVGFRRTRLLHKVCRLQPT
jgi:hypothetical protein